RIATAYLHDDFVLRTRSPRFGGPFSVIESILHMSDIRQATRADRDRILDIAAVSGLFSPDEAEYFAAGFDDWAPEDGDPRRWLVADDGTAAALLAPEAMSDAVWNLLFLATRPEARRRGLARATVAAAETAARAAGARLLLIDTTSGEEQAPARALYGGLGYDREATIRDYYGDGLDRVTFRKRVGL
ncbi:MAG: GNAT family N-acetyltransferase, partial [Pseudomonadota bacterium]